MLARLRWWWWFLLDVALCLIVAAAAGLVFGLYAAREDVPPRLAPADALLKEELMLGLIVTLIIIGVLWWLVENYIPMPDPMKVILRVVIIVAVVLLVLGVLLPLLHVRLPLGQSMALSEDELTAYADWAEINADQPLAELVRELRLRRASAAPVAVIVMEPEQAALLPHLFVTLDQPLLVFAPDGTRLEVFRERQAACVLETYDATSAADLRRRLRDHGLCL